MHKADLIHLVHELFAIASSKTICDNEIGRVSLITNHEDELAFIANRISMGGNNEK